MFVYENLLIIPKTKFSFKLPALLSDSLCMGTDAIRSSLQSPLSSLSQISFTNRLETHIDDVKRGGDLDSGIDFELTQKSASLSSSLAQTNPKAASLFAGYSSFLRYDRAARFVNNLEYANRVQQSVQTKEQVQKQVDKIIAAYTANSPDAKSDGTTATTDAQATDAATNTTHPTDTSSKGSQTTNATSGATTTKPVTAAPTAPAHHTTIQDEILAQNKTA